MTTLLASLALAGAADASDPATWAGERLVWDIRYMGVVGGQAGADAVADDGRLVVEGWCRNAPWYERLYPIDDLVRSTSFPGSGSLRYETRFREGGFHQDQDMRLESDAVRVWRNQEREGRWQESDSTYPAARGAEDPVSAMYHLRALRGEGPWTFPVFTGKKASDLTVEVRGQERLETVLGERDTLRLELLTLHTGQLEQKGQLYLWVTADEQRVPVRMEAKTNFGVIRADLVDYRAPSTYQ